MRNSSLVPILARSFLAGEPGVEQMVARASQVLGKQWRWLRPLAQRYAAAIAGRARLRHRDVVRFLLHDPGFLRARSKYFDQVAVAQWMTGPQRMLPVAAAANWSVPPIESVGDLAAWLRLTPGELDWFADLKGLACKRDEPRLSHYHYRILDKASGGMRLIEAPKPRLKEIQRQILTDILDQIPAHPAAHGFLKGRSIRTFVAPHVGRRVVLRMDLKDFFPTFGGARIQTFFRVLGYPEAVADLLGGLCTNAVPARIWKDAAMGLDPKRHIEALSDARALYSRPHLPQGAPASPALANLCAYRVDCRLAGLAKAAGVEYTRYADDLAFSGGEDWERSVNRFSTHAAAILLDEGFTVQHRKTRVMRQGVRQHLAGLVVNHHANVIRADYDGLKATLTNCARQGPQGQNRDAHPRFKEHLEGRVAFVETIAPSRGKRLRKLLDQIPWLESSSEP